MWRRNILLFLLLLLMHSLFSQSSGTGFALNNGYVATNWHVVDEAKTIQISGIRGDFTKKYNAIVVAKDKINDLAILQISDNGFPGFGTIPYKIKTSTARVAEEIWTYGYPMAIIMGLEGKYTDGRISSLTGVDDDPSMYQISAPIQPGNSGGPLFDSNGDIIGITCASIDNRLAQNVNYAVKTSYLRNLTETMHIANILPENSRMSNYTSRADKVAAVRNFVFYIECWYSNVNGGNNSSMAASTIGKIAGHGYVDLGLSSGRKWATCNVGANNPEEYGNYYAWGEVTTKSKYAKENYYYFGIYSTTLPANSDIASTNWGGGWRMPTKEEFLELKLECDWVWTTQNGKRGYRVRGPNGNSIFLPAAGCKFFGGLFQIGSYGSYWSCSINTSNSHNAWVLEFDSDFYKTSFNDRSYGQTIRPVHD
jgi:hypothetical protein